MRSLEFWFGVCFPCCFAIVEINSSIKHSRAHKQFATWVNTSISLSLSIYLFLTSYTHTHTCISYIINSIDYISLSNILHIRSHNSQFLYTHTYIYIWYISLFLIKSFSHVCLADFKRGWILVILLNSISQNGEHLTKCSYLYNPFLCIILSKHLRSVIHCSPHSSASGMSDLKMFTNIRRGANSTVKTWSAARFCEISAAILDYVSWWNCCLESLIVTRIEKFCRSSVRLVINKNLVAKI